MRLSEWFRSALPATTDAQATPRPIQRNQLARQAALATIVCLLSAFAFSTGTRFLMPGPLSGAHASIESCRSCHAASGSGQFSWIKGLAGGEPHADSKACLTCHKMPEETAFNAHGATTEVLKQSTERLVKIAARTPQPVAARAQDAAFPTHRMMEGGLECATCHQEHQGADFNLKNVSNAQCRSCHVVKFDSFDGQHPTFESYPFERRTRIVFDHAGHFGKHYPEVAKKEPNRTIPATCSTCHDSGADRRVMGVQPFDKTCRTCHLDQITGKERASGPKGIAFLALPGLDLGTLKKKNAAVGEWPEDSDATLTPFMKVIIGRSARGRALVDSVGRLNLQDLSAASDAEVKAVADLAWEIKALFQALITGQAKEVFAGLEQGGGARPVRNIVADLTASLPRDVLVRAQQQWLPNLAKELEGRPETVDRQRSGLYLNMMSPVSTRLAFAATGVVSDAPSLIQLAQAADSGTAAPLAPPGGEGGDASQRRPLPSGTPRMIRGEDEPKEEPARRPAPSAILAPDGAAPADAGADAAATPADSDPANQTDELLSPSEAEQREISAREKGAPPPIGGPATTGAPAGDAPTAAAGASTPGAAGEPAAAAAGEAPAAAEKAEGGATEDGVDPEEWAENGGWYRQDYAIFYRPVGHKDRFIASWLQLTGPGAPKGATTPAAAVFDFLTGKDAQGTCTKCHSIDEVAGQGRTVNFSPRTLENSKGRFTRFVHEPHFGLMEDRGCLSCHELEKGRPYVKSYEQGDPKTFVSNFAHVKKDNCQSCHAAGMARQDCLLCHSYHVNGVVTPVMKTKLPTP